ncbi:MAG: hypothetical protein KGD74_02235 [Candidatus Lokiarchaeota archaeon]|nr:hypothetical protein [Candidatus Lokiarchaeota archaeon]
MVSLSEMFDFTISILSLILITIAIILLIRNYLANKHIHMFYLIVAWLSFLINQIFFLIASLDLGIERHLYMFLAFIDNFFFISGSVFIVLFGESISRKTPSIKKMIWLSTFIAVYSYSSFLNYIIFESIPIPNDIVFLNSSIMNLSFIILMLTGGFLMSFYLFKIYRVAPPNLKRNSLFSFIGGIIFSITPLIFLVGFQQASGLLVLSTSIGMLTIVSAVFIKNPKLAFILPFKVIRLSAINSNSGILLFSHNWTAAKEVKGDHLVSAMFQGIILILRESLGKGDIREINLENAIVIAQKSSTYPVFYILIATRTSKSLKNSLNSFIKHFEIKFSSILDNPINYAKFSAATEIILDIFSHLPE